jgi:hypothetical protein
LQAQYSALGTARRIDGDEDHAYDASADSPSLLSSHQRSHKDAEDALEAKHAGNDGKTKDESGAADEQGSQADEWLEVLSALLALLLRDSCIVLRCFESLLFASLD